MIQLTDAVYGGVERLVSASKLLTGSMPSAKALPLESSPSTLDILGSDPGLQCGRKGRGGAGEGPRGAGRAASCGKGLEHRDE